MKKNLNKEDKHARLKEERRQAIIDAATELFIQNGYNETSVSEIVQKLGIAQGTFYLYFPSKYHVRLAILERSMDAIVEASFTNIEAGWDPVKKLEQSIVRAFQVIYTNRDIIRAVHEDLPMLQYEGETRYKNRRLVDPLSKILKEGKEAGVFSFDSAEVTAYLIISLIEKAAFNAVFFNEPAGTPEMIPAVLDFVKKALV